MNAQDARAMADEANKPNTEAVLESVRAAAKRGQYSVSISLNGKTSTQIQLLIQALRGLGFDCRQSTGDMREPYNNLIINWHKTERWDR